MTAGVLFVLTGVVAVLGFGCCAMPGRFRSVGILFGMAVATSFFLFIAWWQPFPGYPAEVHLSLIAIGLAAAIMFWRAVRAAQAFGVTAALTLASWMLFSAVIFPALTRPEGLA